MRALTAQETQVYTAGHVGTHLRVKVKDSGGTWRDLSTEQSQDWLIRAEMSEGLDGPGPTASVTVRRQVGGEGSRLSLAPLNDNLANQVAGSFSALLKPAREITIETAALPLEVSPASGDWREVFRGRIDRVEFGGEDITLACRDQAGTLLDRWIESEATRGSGAGTAVQTVMQDILTALSGLGVTLYVPASPGFNVVSYIQRKEPVWDALQTLAKLFGWVVRYRWRSGTSQFELTLVDPNRSKTVPDYTWDADHYFDVEDFSIGHEDVRNRVVIVYSDAADLDPAGVPKRKTVTREDATSQTAYGIRFMEVAEAASSQIDTSAEANAMGDAILADLKDPVAEAAFRVPLFYVVEIGDLYRFTANGVHHTSNQDLAVVAYRHVWEPDRCYTTLTLRGAPAGLHDGWLELDARPGIADSAALTGPDAPTGITATPVLHGASIVHTRPARWTETELHLSTSSGFTPSSSTLKMVSQTNRFDVSDLVGGTTYYGKLVARDADGNRSSASSQFSFVAGRELGPAVVQNDGTTLRVLAKGHYSGTGQNGDSVVFPTAYQNPPLVIIKGGANSEPRAKWGATGDGSETGTYDSAKATYDNTDALNLDASGFDIRARLRQKSGSTPVSVNADVADNLLDAVGETASATLASAASGAVADQYTLRYFVRLDITGTVDTDIGAEMSVDVAIDSIDNGGGSWTERASYSYDIVTLASGGASQDWNNEAKTVTVSGLTSAATADQFRIRIKSITTGGVTSGTYSVEVHLFSTAATVPDATGGLTYATASDNFASKTFDGDDVVAWESIEVS